MALSSSEIYIFPTQRKPVSCYPESRLCGPDLARIQVALKDEKAPTVLSHVEGPVRGVNQYETL